MKVIKDGSVWSAYDSELNICISGRTKSEAIQSLTKAQALLKNPETEIRLREKPMTQSQVITA